MGTITKAGFTLGIIVWFAVEGAINFLEGFLSEEQLNSNLWQNVYFQIALTIIIFAIFFHVVFNAYPDAINSYVEGIEAWNNQDFETAFSKLKPYAEDGDAQAQECVGVCYYSGLGTNKDHYKAVDWLKKAGAQGQKDVYGPLGWTYGAGEMIPQDIPEAVKWYKLAVDEGDEDAPFLIGSLYYCCGETDASSLKEAHNFLEISAKQQNHAKGQFFFGLLYYNGDGVTADYNEALKWFNLSGEQGEAFAQFYLGNMYQNGIGVEIDYEKAFSWYSLAAEQSDTDAQNNLGKMYYNGEGMAVNKIEAQRLFQLAADQDDETAQINLDILMEEGIPEEYNRALQLQTSKAIKDYRNETKKDFLTEGKVVKFPTKR